MDRDHTLVVYGEDNDALYEAIAEHGQQRGANRAGHRTLKLSHPADEK